ncbi:hypothetical protein M5K25_000161 [Dendrobium thyrsiflorum]|uniref:Uncharacterized protein n=1 Tax=Dendrobium thyrsiflorum TaxID=117978 RepID=A0ABD0VT96_DENTH
MSLQQQLYSPPPPPEPMTTTTRYPSKDSWGSIGPVIGVLAVIAVLGILAGVIGRLCSGRRILGLGPFDVEGWIERKCSCIDGGISSPPPLPPPLAAAEEVAHYRGSPDRPKGNSDAPHHLDALGPGDVAHLDSPPDDPDAGPNNFSIIGFNMVSELSAELSA